MLKLLTACLLIIGLAGCVAPGPAPAPTLPAATATPATSTINEPNGLATLTYPAGWQLVDTGNPNFIMAGDTPLQKDQTTPPEGARAHYVALAAQQDTADATYSRQQLIDMARSDLGPLCSQERLTNVAEDVTIDGQSGVWVACKGKTEGRAVYASVAYAARGHTVAAAFTLAFDDTPWEQLKPMFKTIISGVKFAGH